MHLDLVPFLLLNLLLYCLFYKWKSILLQSPTLPSLNATALSSSAPLYSSCSNLSSFLSWFFLIYPPLFPSPSPSLLSPSLLPPSPFSFPFSPLPFSLLSSPLFPSPSPSLLSPPPLPFSPLPFSPSLLPPFPFSFSFSPLFSPLPSLAH